MRSALLQKLLDKQKQTKYGDFVAKNQWNELHTNVYNGTTKLDDILPPLIDSGKLINFTQYVATVEPNPTNIKILTQLINKLPSDQLSELTPFFKNLVLGFTQFQSQIVDMLVRSFFITDSSAFVDTLVTLLEAIPSIHSSISSSITKFFPQTNFPVEQQVRFLRSSLILCRASNDVAFSSLGRIFQHLVALDCELLLDSSDSNDNSNSLRLDDDVAQCFIPQLHLFLDFAVSSNETIFTLLLQFFDRYLIDLPRVVAVQFIYFFSSSLKHSNVETFIGFLLAKMLNDSDSDRSRCNAALYIESLIVHARFVDDNFAILAVDYVSDFANCYANHIRNEAPERLRMDVKMHNVYYFAVQCVVYIICWRWKRWTSKSKKVDHKINIVERWHIDDLLCNELRAIDVIDKNTSDMIKSLNLFDIKDESIVIERISVWFPFDPCPLEEIANDVMDNYILWSEADADVEYNEDEDLDSLLNNELSRLCENRIFNFDLNFPSGSQNM